MLEDLRKQFSGAMFGELIFEHFKKQNQDEILGAFQFIRDEIVRDFGGINFDPLIEIWHSASKNKVLFRGDCGVIFNQITNSFEEFNVGLEHLITNENSLSFFNLIVLNLAFNAHYDLMFRKDLKLAINNPNSIGKLFLSKEEKKMISLWREDTLLDSSFDSFEYARKFPKAYFNWFYQDYGFHVDEIKTYCYSKNHIRAISSHYRGNRGCSAKKALSNFITFTFRVNRFIALTAKNPFVINCHSLSMANRLVKEFISERYGIEGKDWEILGSAYLTDENIKYGTIRVFFGDHSKGKFKYFFDFTLPNSNPMVQLV